MMIIVRVHARTSYSAVAGYYRQLHDVSALAMSTLADWYTHAFDTADTYIVVCSAATTMAFTAGRTRRHTADRPDLFGSMCARVLRVCAGRIHVRQ
jgi:hypothetical protein